MLSLCAASASALLQGFAVSRVARTAWDDAPPFGTSVRPCLTRLPAAPVSRVSVFWSGTPPLFLRAAPRRHVAKRSQDCRPLRPVQLRREGDDVGDESVGHQLADFVLP